MSQLPLQLIFWIDGASLWSGRYRETIQSYHDQLRLSDAVGFGQLPRPYAYILLTDAEKPLLSEAIDWLYSRDVMPHAQDGTQVNERKWNEALYLLDRPELQANPYTLLVKGDAQIRPGTGQSLFQLLSHAVGTLHSNHHIVSVGFPASFTFQISQPVNEAYSIAQSVTWPAVVRTRDLYLAALLSLQPGVMGGGLDVVGRVLGKLSYHPARHLTFNQSIATVMQ